MIIKKICDIIKKILPVINRKKRIEGDLLHEKTKNYKHNAYNVNDIDSNSYNCFCL